MAQLSKMAAPTNDYLLELAAATNNDDLLNLWYISQFRDSIYNPDGPRFELDSYNDEQCLANFRFERDDLRRLARALKLPETIECPN